MGHTVETTATSNNEKHEWDDGIYIGISSGHARSTVLASSRHGTQLAVVCSDSLNTHADTYDVVAYRLARLLGLLCERIGIDKCDLMRRTLRLVLAVPEVATEGDQALAQICLKMSGWTDIAKAQIADDTWAMLVAGTGTYEGVCAYSGTGASVLVGLDNVRGKSYKIDGRGPVLGDFGSAFQLATDMFRFFCRSCDRGVIPPLFDEFLHAEPEIGDIDGVQKWFDVLLMMHPHSWRAMFARSAEVVLKAADGNPPDPDAVALVEDAAGRMAESIELATTRGGAMVRSLPVVFHGWMFERSSLFREEVMRIVRKITRGSVSMSVFRTVVGANLIATSSISAPPASLMVSNTWTAVNSLPPDEQELLRYPSSILASAPEGLASISTAAP